MGRVHVVGGGLAGLSAALAALDGGHAVTLYEASPHLGGRCRSYHDAKLGRLIDNGTHALAGANPAALALLDRLGHRGDWVTADEDVLRIADLCEDKTRDRLRHVAPPTLRTLLPGRGGPAGHGNLARPGLSDLAGLARTLGGPDRTVASLFRATAFYRDVIDPLTIAALNTPSGEASSRLLAAVLRAGLRGGCGAAPLMPLIARRGLGPDLVDPLADAIRAKGGTIRQGVRVEAMARGNDRATRLETQDGPIALASDDRVCLAVPAQLCGRLMPESVGAVDVAPSPIVNAHFVLDRPVADTRPHMFAVLGGASQWIAIRGDLVSTTVSAADALNAADRETVFETLWSEARRACACLGQALPERPMAWRVVKERWATLRQVPKLGRPGAGTALANVALAGDWTATGLPFTIEGAIRSGQTAIRQLAAQG